MPAQCYRLRLCIDFKGYCSGISNSAIDGLFVMLIVMAHFCIVQVYTLHMYMSVPCLQGLARMALTFVLLYKYP